jgi:hypothetical protein
MWIKVTKDNMGSIKIGDQVCFDSKTENYEKSQLDAMPEGDLYSVCKILIDEFILEVSGSNSSFESMTLYMRKTITKEDFCSGQGWYFER